MISVKRSLSFRLCFSFRSAVANSLSDSRTLSCDRLLLTDFSVMWKCRLYAFGTTQVGNLKKNPTTEALWKVSTIHVEITNAWS